MRALAQSDAASVQRLATEVDDEHPLLVRQLDREVSDIAGLAIVERFLFARPRERSAMPGRTGILKAGSARAASSSTTPARQIAYA
jgi:hypothetical protein